MSEAESLDEEGLFADDRRSHPRVSDRPPLQVSGMRAIVHDVSRNGICLILPEPVARGERFRLELTDTLELCSRTMEGEVVWFAHNRAGLRWVNLTPADDQWLLERFQAWMRSLEGATRR